MKKFFFVAALIPLLLNPVNTHAQELGSESMALQPINAPIVNGVLTSGYPSVAAILNQSGQVNCTGTLIGCETVLTAAHCFCGNTPGSLCQPDFADNSFVFFQHGGVFGIQSATIHPDYLFGVRSDLAIVKLSSPVSGIAPTSINTTMSPVFGSQGPISGFGRIGGTSELAGIKRVGTIETTSCSGVFPEPENLCWEFDEPIGSPGEHSNTCLGDSGGPLFLNFGSGLRVAGVTSGGFSVGSDCLQPAFTSDTNVFSDRQWILNVGGSDLNNTSCQPLPSAGTPLAPISYGFGELSSSNVEDRYIVDVPNGTDLLGVTINGEDSGNFDLYLKAGSPPTTTSFDCASVFGDQFDGCGIANPSPGSWHLLVNRASGSGMYQVTATNFLGSGSGGTGCTPDANTLCLQDGRFRVTIDFRRSGQLSEPGKAIPFTERAGMFWFFNENNIELLVKVLDACVEPFNHFWVFFAATTNVEFEMVVVDTQTGAEKRYSNPQGQPALPVQDTGAFATCP